MATALTEKFSRLVKTMSGQARITESNVQDMLREVRMALLEADVALPVVRDFVARVKEKALGQEVLGSLKPGQALVGIVNRELAATMGEGVADINLAAQPPAVILMAGLQGSGKTTTCAKLAKLLKKDGKSPVLIAADVYRPAAIEQLQTLAGRVGVPCYAPGAHLDPVDIARDGVAYARQHGDVAIIDTAGRLHVDEELMAELVNIRDAVKPHNVLLVVDSMTGQDAVNAADAFRGQVDLDGVVLTKLDGDARGGAALSVRAVTGKPIKFVSTGEKLDDFDVFHPDRMASRILGMGDVLSLIEKAEQNLDEKQAAEMEAKLRRAEFTFEDFLEQLKQVRKMGSLSSILSMLPGVPGMKDLKNVQVDDSQLDRIEAMIFSMTPQERRHPDVIDGSRRRRIAAGSGTSIQDVNLLLKQYREMQKMLKMFAGGKMRGFRLPGMSG